MIATFRCFFFCLIMMSSLIFAGNVYYVDATGGNDLNDGLLLTSAWKSIAKVNETLFSADDKILFKRGEIWREQLIVPSSRITFGAYGSGTKPVISGADDVTSWLQINGNVCSTFGVTTEPHIVINNGKVLKENDGAILGVGPNEWDWGSNILYINLGENPDIGILEVGQRSVFNANSKDYITLENIEFKYSNAYGVYLENRNNWIFNNVTFTGCCGGILLQDNTNDIIVKNCVISDSCGSHSHSLAIQIENANAAHHIKIDNNIISNGDATGIRCCLTNPGGGGAGIIYAVDITNNIIHNNAEEGIIVYSEAPSSREFYDFNITGNTIHHNIKTGMSIQHFNNTSGANIISNNTVYENCTGDLPGGIWLHTVNSFTVEGNSVYNNHTNYYDGRGIYFDEGTSNSIMRYNKIFGHTDDISGHDASAGIAITGTTARGANSNNQIYYNISYENYYGIVATGDNVSNLTVYNNVFYNNSGDGLYIRSNFDSTVLTLRNNIISDNAGYGVNDAGTGDPTHDYNCVYDNNFGNYNGLPTGVNSITSNPIFVDASNGDFHLQISSSCIDVGINVGLTTDYSGNTVPVGWAVDIGAYEYQDNTPGKPVASFTAYPTEGIPPLEVSFDASTSYDPDGNITSYEWDFGDGNTGSGITVTHTYQNRGTYTAKLTVTDNDELSTSASEEIKVGTPPEALFEAFPSSGNSPLKVEFDASYSYDTDGEIVFYNWDFGDGTQGPGKHATHTYYAYGEYTAILKITDNDGLSDSTSEKIKVMEKPYPPLDVKVTRMTNGGYSSSCFCRIDWRRNPKNNGKHNIVKYRIYRKIRTENDSAYALIKEVSYHTFEYDDRSLEDKKELNIYAYAVSAVDDKNRESKLGKPTFP